MNRATALRARYDAVVASAIVAVLLLLGAPAGLLWSAVSPRLTVVLAAGKEPSPQGLEGKAFIGADGSFVVVCLLAGVLCGVLAWFVARRSGPWTVVALVIGGLLAAKVAAVVGVRPGKSAVMAVLHDPKATGTVELFLRLRTPWSVVAWPVGALMAFLIPAYLRPDELD